MNMIKSSRYFDLQSSEGMSRLNIDAVADTEQFARPSVKLLHPYLYIFNVGTFVWMLFVMALTLWSTSQALFMIAISAAYGAVYIGVPLICVRMNIRAGWAPDWGDFRSFLEADMETFTGRVSGLDAAAQVCGIPLALAFCTTGLCCISLMTS